MGRERKNRIWLQKKKKTLQTTGQKEKAQRQGLTFEVLFLFFLLVDDAPLVLSKIILRHGSAAPAEQKKKKRKKRKRKEKKKKRKKRKQKKNKKKMDKSVQIGLKGEKTKAKHTVLATTSTP